MNVTVYTLSSTRDEAVRYVGQTVQVPAARLRQHRSDAMRRHKTPVQKWIAREVQDGFEIRMAVVATGAVLHDAEREQIALHRASGHRLLNLTDGGEGTPGWRGNAGRKRPDLAQRNRLAAGKPGHAISEESKAKISAAKRGRKQPHLIEANKRRAGLSGHKHTEESKAKIGAAHRGKVTSEETRRKIGAANAGRKLSPEQVAALRAAHRRYVEEKRACQ